MVFYQSNLIRKSLSAFERDRKLESNAMPYAHVFWFWQINWDLICINDKEDSLKLYCILIIIVIVISFLYAITAFPTIEWQYARDIYHVWDKYISFRRLNYSFLGYETVVIICVPD